MKLIYSGLDKLSPSMYNITEHLNMVCLQGRVKFPIGGKVRERESADLVQLQNQQYSLDGRRCVKISELGSVTCAPIVILTPERQRFFRVLHIF